MVLLVGEPFVGGNVAGSLAGAEVFLYPLLEYLIEGGEEEKEGKEGKREDERRESVKTYSLLSEVDYWVGEQIGSNVVLHGGGDSDIHTVDG